MERQAHDTPAPEGKRGRFTMLARPEGYILLTGCGMALLYVLWVVAQGEASADMFRVLLGMTATNVVFGRAAGMSFGYLSDSLHPVMVAAANMWIETVFVLVLYPLFVLSWEQLIAWPLLDRLLAGPRKAAEARHDLLCKYGMIGVFVFVWLPFWMTGPMVGAIIGFLIGLRPWTNMAVVLSGTYVATVIWAVFLHEVHDRIAVYGAYAPASILAVIVAAAIAGHVWHRRRETRHTDHEEQGEGL